MAIVSPTTVSTGSQDGSVYKVTWPNINTTDTEGAPINAPDFADRSVQVTGTFGAGGTIGIQGSNDGTNFFPLTDPQGNPISITAAGAEQVSELCAHMKPVLTGGDGTTDLTITAIIKRQNNLRT